MHEGEAGRSLEVLTSGGAIVFLADSNKEDERHDVCCNQSEYVMPLQTGS